MSPARGLDDRGARLAGLVSFSRIVDPGGRAITIKGTGTPFEATKGLSRRFPRSFPLVTAVSDWLTTVT
ncbi:hypothetical protein [Amycolatopsis plumensis]|uniref:hypothetical protein n=1 Tax=Amycolatopsis plumensis TaxID=236508 RepID=UPI003611F277